MALQVVRLRGVPSSFRRSVSSRRATTYKIRKRGLESSNCCSRIVNGLDGHTTIFRKSSKLHGTLPMALHECRICEVGKRWDMIVPVMLRPSKTDRERWRLRICSGLKLWISRGCVNGFGGIDGGCQPKHYSAEKVSVLIRLSCRLYERSAPQLQ